jgi:hypothetical protein
MVLFVLINTLAIKGINIMEITKKQDLPEFCKVGCQVGLVLYKPFASYPV